jgi:pimeloyl-ACP methyl ester carboxylesterase
MMRAPAEKAYEFDEPFVLGDTKYQSTFGLPCTPLASAVATTAAWYRSQPKTKGDERMSTAANHTTPASHSSSVPAVQKTSYLSRPDGRIGCDVAGHGSLVVLVPGMGDLRAGYRFLAPALRAAGYRVACTDLRGHVDSDTMFTSCGDEETAGDVIALIGELGGPAVVVGNSMGAGAAALAAAQRPGLVSSLVPVGPFVRNGKTSSMRRLLLRVAMAPPWAAVSWKSYLPKLCAGRRPADFGEYRDQVVASLRRPGYARAFSRTTRTSHDPAEARLAEVTAPVLVVMGEQDPDFPDPRAEADWIAGALSAQVVMVPEAGHYPQSQRPDITTGAVLRFLGSVKGRA